MANQINWQPLTDAIYELLPERADDSNKGTFGKCLVVAGSINYTGAAYLATTAAMRSGAGLVTLATPGDQIGVMQVKLTECTFLPLPSDMGVISGRAVEPIEKAIDERGYDAVLVGCGLGQERETQQFVYRLLGIRREARQSRTTAAIGFGSSRVAGSSKSEQPVSNGLPDRLVLDADALNALAALDGEAWWAQLPGNTVITPHPGELARLLGGGYTAEDIQHDREAAVAEAAERFGCTVVLKGAHTLIASQNDGYRSDFASALLATAGTGDVLAGLIAGLLAQGMAAHEAAAAGVLTHARAAELAAKRLGIRSNRGLLAGDLLPFIPAALGL